MRLLLGSGGYRTPERVALLGEQMRSFFGPLRRLLFVPHALHDHESYVRKMTERGLHAVYRVVRVDERRTLRRPAVQPRVVEPDVTEAERRLARRRRARRLVFLFRLERLGQAKPAGIVGVEVRVQVPIRSTRAASRVRDRTREGVRSSEPAAWGNVSRVGAA